MYLIICEILTNVLLVMVVNMLICKMPNGYAICQIKN